MTTAGRLALVLMLTLLAACARPAAAPPPASPAAPAIAKSTAPDAAKAVPSLAEACDPYFAVGTVLSPTAIAKFGDLIPQQFRCVTPESHMKWKSIEPREGEFDFKAADQIVEFAEKHHLRINGHTLVWHDACPDWVFQAADGSPAPRELVEQRLRRHILAVVGRYRGRIESWDVVNEALSMEKEGGDDLRDTKWHQALGDDFIALAFRIAHEADPKARLIYNDFSLENPVKRERLIRLIKKLQAEKVPIDAIGMQAHWGLVNPSVGEVRATLDALAPLGLPVEISEFDMSFFRWNDQTSPYQDGPPADLLDIQAHRYGEFFALFRERSALVRRVTMWGTADRMTYRRTKPVEGRKDYPLLFDDADQPKPAFWSVIEAMRAK